MLLMAVWGTIRSAAPPAEPTVPVAVADRELAAGSLLAEADLRIVAWPARLSPDDRVSRSHAAGQILATAVGSGEAITTRRLLGPGLLAGQPPGLVAVTVRVTDPATLAPIRAGDRIDVLAVRDSQDQWTSAGSELRTGQGADAAGDAGPAAGDSASGDRPTGAPSPTGSASSMSTADTGSTATRSAVADQVAPVSSTVAADPAPAGADLVAASALVLSKPADLAADTGNWSASAFSTDHAAGSGQESGVVVLAVDRAAASRLAGVAPGRPLSVVLLHPGSNAP